MERDEIDNTPYWYDEWYDDWLEDDDDEWFEPDDDELSLWGLYDDNPGIVDSTDSVYLCKAKNGHLTVEYVALFLLDDGQLTFSSSIYRLGECDDAMRHMLIELGRDLAPGRSMQLSNEIIDQYLRPEPLEQPVISAPTDLDDIPF